MPLASNVVDSELNRDGSHIYFRIWMPSPLPRLLTTMQFIAMVRHRLSISVREREGKSPMKRICYDMLVSNEKGAFAALGKRIAANHPRAHATIVGCNTEGSE